jgi:hypothetical protein
VDALAVPGAGLASALWFANLDNDTQEKYLGALKHLCDAGVINACPPLCDIKVLITPATSYPVSLVEHIALH